MKIIEIHLDGDHGISAQAYNDSDPITKTPERYYYSSIYEFDKFIDFVNDYSQKGPVRLKFSWVY